MLIKKYLVSFLVVLALFLSSLGFTWSCTPGFQSAPVTMEDVIPDVQDVDDGVLVPPAPGTTTTTTALVPPPTSTTLPVPPGGRIHCPAYGGRFGSSQQIINHANQVGDSSCIRLNGSVIRQGFGPCVECTEDNWRPPGTTTTTTRVPGPTTTTTGWPTTTTRPGSAAY